MERHAKEVEVILPHTSKTPPVYWETASVSRIRRGMLHHAGTSLTKSSISGEFVGREGHVRIGLCGHALLFCYVALYYG